MDGVFQGQEEVEGKGRVHYLGYLGYLDGTTMSYCGEYPSPSRKASREGLLDGSSVCAFH